MTVRYMGTKRHMVDHVRDAIRQVAANGRLLDLFAGMGTVAASVHSDMSVVVNDALHFPGVFARARFLGPTRGHDADAALKRIEPSYRRHVEGLRAMYQDDLKVEAQAVAASRDALHRYMSRSPHVGNSPERRRVARRAAEASGGTHYQLAALYFSAGYFSLDQSVQIDALRAAIDEDRVTHERDWLLAAWLGAASAAINSPGHTAQFLSARSDSGYERVLRSWGHDIERDFIAALERMSQVGSQNWRAQNEVLTGDALSLLGSRLPSDIGIIYADPPYTRDHYSRFYHVYETLFLYDFPDARGQGRTRSGGFISDFSSKTRVSYAFHALFRGAARQGVPVVLSYPSSGLLERAGGSIEDIARSHSFATEVREISAQHSTLGASGGRSRIGAAERIYICRPSGKS